MDLRKLQMLSLYISRQHLYRFYIHSEQLLTVLDVQLKYNGEKLREATYSFNYKQQIYVTI